MSPGLVGSIVGEVASLPSGAGSTLTDAGLGYDVAIGGLGFKLKIGDESPYERATAQFKKDQFDSSGNYGDQSLLGYWTVGQFSFHKGAGIKFYDANDDTVLNRYRDSVGVHPFTEGEVSLQPEWVNLTSTAVTDVRWAGASEGGFFALVDDVTFKYATALGAALTSYTPTAGTVDFATVGPKSGYVGTTSNKIERIGIAAGAPASGAIYTHATTFQDIFYAKGRLWVLDSLGVWYQLAPDPVAPPVAIAAGDKLFGGFDPLQRAYLAETPGPVLIGQGARIYAVTLNADGSVPTLAAPTQVAELPTGETLRGMTYHLGFLALATSAGIRIGVVSEAGQVTYGPLLVNWADAVAGTTIGRLGSSVFISGGSGVFQSKPGSAVIVTAGSGTPELFEVDLSRQIGDGLEFGWARRTNPYSGTPTAYGTFTWGGNRLATFSTASAKYAGGNLAASGSLTTGLLRYGTLDPKHFHTVRVRFGGTGGTIQAYRVMADGSEISLYTIDVLASTEDEITLGLSSPIELLGLKFVLTRSGTDATKGPTLLGYQLRALPTPKRQRLIRLPLMLMDVERRGTTRSTGYEGSAWDRLSALEDMEQSGGVFQYQDFRTGEAGAVYIESIEHQGKTPPGKQNDGFGGVVFLTLRKL